MTPAEELAVVRAGLERMVALSEASSRSWQESDNSSGWWSPDGLDDGSLMGETEDRAFIAAASPDRLLRLAREALGVLDRHRPGTVGWCTTPLEVDCPEVESVLRAWQP